MKEIELSQGVVALVDDEDYQELSKYKWCAAYLGRTCYAMRYVRKADGNETSRYMHRAIFGDESAIRIDHIDGNGLNNTRDNLRFATNQQNGFNRSMQRNNRSGYKGVSWYRSGQKWLASIRVNGKSKHLGYFEDKEDAARAYDKAAHESFGEFAKVNFP